MSNESQLAVQSAPAFALSTIEEAMNFATQMAKANLLPPHLKNSPADCLRVVMQASRWQMDPFAVADKTSVISGKLMYEGQLVSAVVNARGGLSKRLDYKFDGEGEKRVLTVSGVLKGEAEPRTITLDVPMARRINKNGQMNQNPDQQMCYIGARMWARRHTSELMLGVYTPDEIEEAPDGEPRDVTPTIERPAPKPRSPKGAAAVKNNEKVVDAEVTTVAENPTMPEPVKQAAPVPVPAPAPKPVESFADAATATEAAPESKPESKPAAEAKPEPKSAKAAAKVEQRALLHDGETIEVTANISAFKVITGTRDGKPHPYVTAEIESPEFKGQVSQTDGGISDGKPIAAWQLDAPVRIKVRGKKFANGRLANVVDAIEVVESGGGEV